MALPLAAAATSIAAYLDAKYHLTYDLSAIYGAIQGQKAAQNVAKSRGVDDWSLYRVFDDSLNNLRSTGISNKDCLVFEDRTWSYEAAAHEIGRLAIELARQGLKNGDHVAIILNNSPEFYFVLWACWKIGAIPATVNASLTKAPLEHCLKIIGTKTVITTFELVDTLGPTVEDYGREVDGMKMLVHDCESYAQPKELRSGWSMIRQSELPVTGTVTEYPLEKRPKKRTQDTGMMLYTSGTTGKPKAVEWPCGYGNMYSLSRFPYVHNRSDRWFLSLPMFHGTALWGCMVPSIGAGSTVIIARKFSTSTFWKSAVEGNANSMLYVGELCRYLVHAPPSSYLPDEHKSHGIKKMYGLGMTASTWLGMRDRFGIEVINEYFSASEATASMINRNTGPFGLGKVGRSGPLLRWYNKNVVVVKVDKETGDLWRDPKGFCELSDVGVPGEVLTKLDPADKGVAKRHGYYGNGEATDEKTVRNVFETGDAYWRIGDLLTRDKDGFVSFTDRLGDTYRNKGHNVSTTEVEDALSSHSLVTSANVFAIPMNAFGYEGQVGCGVVTVKPGFEVGQLEHFLLQSAGLPAYAVPRFLRVAQTDGAGVSTVFKKHKVAYKADGFSLPTGSPDAIYWIEREKNGYVPFTDEVNKRVKSRQANF